MGLVNRAFTACTLWATALLTAAYKGKTEALHDTNQTLQTTIETLPLALMRLDPAGNVQLWNPAAERILGWRAAEVLGGPPLHVFPENEPESRANLATVLAGKSVGEREARRRRRDGSLLDINFWIAPLRNVQGQVTGAVALIADITERKRMEQQLHHAYQELERRVQERTAELVHANTALHTEIAERRQLTEALRESEAKFRGLLEAAPDAVIITDSAGCIMLVNAQTEQIFGYPREVLLGRPVETLLPERLRHRHTLHRAAYAVQPSTRPMGSDLELYGQRADGTEFPVEVSLSPLATHEGLLVMSILRDITVRRQLEETLRGREAQYRTLFEHSLDAIFSGTPDGRILAANPAACALLGYTETEICRLGREALHDPDDPQYLAGIEERTRTGKFRGELTLVRKGGQKFPAEVASTIFVDPQGQRKTTVIARDLTVRKQMEEALRQERNLLQITLASIGDGVITTDTRATLTFMNPMAERLTGWTAQEALGHPITEVLPLYDEDTRQPVPSPVDQVLREGTVVGMANHTLLITQDGREISIADSGAPIRSSSGPVQGTVMVFRDVTDQKRVEEALIRAKEAAEAADRAKSEFLATISHELRTPLHIILGYAELLKDELSDVNSQQHEQIQRIWKNARELHELISAVLDLNRLEVGQLPVHMTEVFLPALLAEMQEKTQEARTQSPVQVNWQAAPQLPPVYTDPGKLKVIIKNLLGNAMKFTDAGSITVAARELTHGVEIRVSDTGRGIPPESLQRIFEPFYQVKSADAQYSKGTGLGLHIVKRLLDLLGGTVTAESEVGRGSSFRVWIPTATQERSPGDGHHKAQ
jgi:PAS domain S-box-containing protein